MGRGNTILSCYFGITVVSYITTSKELRDTRNYTELFDTIQKVF